MKAISKIRVILIASIIAVLASGCTGSVTMFESPAPAAPQTTASSAPSEEQPSTQTDASEADDEGDDDEESSEIASEPSEDEESSEAEAPSAPESSTPAEESSQAEQSQDIFDENRTDYLYFDNSVVQWENVYAYWWNANFDPITNKLTGELYPANNEDGTQDLKFSWPGVQMERIEGTDIYKCVMPVGATKIKFNSGVSNSDVKAGKEAHQTNDLTFNEAEHAGKVFTFATNESKVERGDYESMLTHSNGTWSD